MELDKRSIDKEIKVLSKYKTLLRKEDVLDFIGEKCLEVLREQTEIFSRETVGGSMEESYVEGHTYEKQILGNSSLIILSNMATNQFGEYISEYIEYGTGIFSPNSTKPEGWVYPTDVEDKNVTKRQLENGDLVAFTMGQVAKPVYETSMEIISQRINGWLDEYLGGKL